MAESKHNERGAGRKPYLKPEEKTKSRSIRLTDIEWQTFKALGGVKWLRAQLKEGEE